MILFVSSFGRGALWSAGTLALLGSLLSCSGVEEGPGAERMAALSQASGFCTEWAEAACNETVVRHCAARNQDACIASQQTYCERLMPAMDYEADQAMVCLDAVKAAYDDGELDATERDIVHNLAEPCEQMFSGSLGEGESCSRSNECRTEDGLTCVIRQGDSLGTCQEREVVEGGFSCTEVNQVCAEGFYCDGEHCVATRQDGDSCDEKNPCAQDLECVSEDDVQECKPKYRTGEGCREDNDCLSDICVRSPGAERGLCADTLVLSAGDALCDSLR